MKPLPLVLLLIIQTIHTKELFISYSSDGESLQLFKYFHGMESEFYVDIGAFDPIIQSKTAHFTAWKGLNVEANPNRHKLFMLSRQKQTNLNMAVTDQTGGYSTLVEYDNEATASINQEFIQKHAKPGVTARQWRVPQVTLAILCHIYYPVRPKLMRLHVSGHGVVALQSNDWKEEKCLPEVMVVERSAEEQYNNKQRQILEVNGYVSQSQTPTSRIFVHKYFVDLYKQREEEGSKLLSAMTVKDGTLVLQELLKIIVPTLDSSDLRHIDPRYFPVYLHFATQKLLSVDTLRTASQFLSSVNKPILLLHFSSLQSKLYLGSQNYKITKINLTYSETVLYRIQIAYKDSKVILYVLQNDPKGPELHILDRDYEQAPKCAGQKFSTLQKVVNSDNYLGRP